MRASPTPVSVPLWRALRSSTEPQPASQLSRITGAPPAAAHFQLRRWLLAGLVTRTDHRPRGYRMADTDPTPPRMSGTTPKPRTPTQRQRIWAALRVIRSFDMIELASTSEQPRGCITSYLTSLMRAGYVEQTISASGRHGRLARYVVVKRSGPKAPSISQVRRDGRLIVTLVDPNDGTRVDISPGTVSLRGCIKRNSAVSSAGGGEN